jgi:hypothetical protein
VVWRPYHCRGMDAHGGDQPASVFLRSATPVQRVICDVEREAIERARGDGRGQPREAKGYRVGLAQLEATLAGVYAAHAAGDSIALRGELVNLAAQAAVWASELPVPGERRARAKAAA